jgi:hypothetical protein
VTHLLAWTPFIDPIAFDRYWYLLIIPMSFFIAVGYKSVRTVDMRKYWLQVLFFTVQMVIAITAIGIGAFVFVYYLLPTFAPMPN